MSSTDRFIGRVKWFNNKAGYGFITVTDGPKAGTDVFVHHSVIKVAKEIKAWTYHILTDPRNPRSPG